MKKILFVMLFCNFIFCKNIDYDKLDLKYYPYIAFYEKFSDDEIEGLIKAVDNGEKKTGVFLGLEAGVLDNADNLQNASYGIKLGYQSFLPSFLDRLSYPGFLGMRTYIQYFSIFPQETTFGREKLSNISLAWDLLLDIPVMRNFDAGIVVGAGAGSMVYQNEANSSFSFLVNFGFGVSLFGHNRIDFELKIMTNASVDWFGAFYGVGYSYVF